MCVGSLCQIAESDRCVRSMVVSDRGASCVRYECVGSLSQIGQVQVCQIQMCQTGVSDRCVRCHVLDRCITQLSQAVVSDASVSDAVVSDCGVRSRCRNVV